MAIIAGQLVVGGAERQLYLWLSHLNRKKFHPVVVTLHSGFGDYWEKPIESLDIPLLRIPHRRSRIVRLLDIVRVLRPYKPELIHSWHLFPSPYAGAAAKLLGAKSLGSIRGSYKNFLNSTQERIFALHLVDAMMVNSSTVGLKLRAFSKRKRQSIYVVKNALEDQICDRLATREKLSRRFGLPKEGIWLGSLGRLYPLKRFDLILKTLPLLREHYQNIYFFLIGDGPERSRLERLAKSLDLADTVIFPGEVPGANAWLSALDIFCFTSLDEGLPNVVMEAAMAGLPIVSWRLPFIEELLENGKSALLVEPENLLSLKDSLLELIKSSELRSSLGQAARNHVLKEFTLDRFILNMTHMYDDVLNGQRHYDYSLS